MQDIKHITKNRGGLLSRFARKQSRTGLNTRRPLPAPPRKKKPGRKWFLPFVTICVGVWAIYALITSPAQSPVSTPKVEARVAPAPLPKPALPTSLDPFQSLQFTADFVPAAASANGRLQASLPDGGSVLYNLDPELQQRVTAYLNERRVPYAAVVAIEPKSGRLLGLITHSAVDKGWEKRGQYGIYPMASLFKIITASAALNQNKITPDSIIQFNGKLTSVDPRRWEPRGKRAPEMTLTDAMGKSVNPVFGRVASSYVGSSALVSQAEQFGFNRQLFPGTSVLPSTIYPPKSEMELRLMGAGLGREVKISPLHAAAVMGALANHGVMMTPLLAEKVTGGRGETIFAAESKPLQRILSEETTLKVARTLSTTVQKGTSRRAFHDRRGRALLGDINIAAKTGSIDGKDPEGQYTWFAAYAPMENPQIALVALVINQGRWNIKASQVGEKALEAFFR